MNSNLLNPADPSKQSSSYAYSTTSASSLQPNHGLMSGGVKQNAQMATFVPPQASAGAATSSTNAQYTSASPAYAMAGQSAHQFSSSAQQYSTTPQDYTTVQQNQTTQYGSPQYTTTTTTREYASGGDAGSSFQQYGQLTQTNQSHTMPQQYGQSEQQYSQAIQQFGPSYSSAIRHTTEQDAIMQRGVSQVRVVGHEYGQERVISVQQRVDESRTQIVGERYVEHEVRVPKKIIREDIIEKVVVIPERRFNEEIIEEIAKVKEKIIEIARPIIVEKIVEVPEYEYVERIVEVPEKIVQEKVLQKEVVHYHDRIIDRPVVQYVEETIEVPEIQYRDVPTPVYIEVPEYQEEIIWNDKRRDQYRDVAVPRFIEKEYTIDIDREIPIPVEANVTYEYRLPKIKPRYNKITYPVYLPRFIEIPVAVELLNAGLISQAETHLRHIGLLPKTVASLCEIENLATTIMKADLQSQISSVDLQAAVLKAWQEGTLQFTGTPGYASTTTTTVANQTMGQVFSN